MPMPKGFKAEHGYFTSKESGGLAYREIADLVLIQLKKTVNR